MPTNVDLNPTALSAKPPRVKVFLRRLWPSEWTEFPYLYPDELVWAVAPGISQARFSWRYGKILQADATAAAEFARLDVARWYVKVELTDADDEAVKWYWYGILENPSDKLGGLRIDKDDVKHRNGVQQWPAFGLELLLDRHIIRESVSLDQQLPGEVVIPRGLTYNWDNKPNRTTNRNGGIPRHRFTGPDEAEHWSTRDIVESLLVDQSPRAPDGTEIIRWRMTAADRDLLPDWDQPLVETHGRTTREVLNELLDRRRLMSYYIEVNEEGDETEVRIRPFTYVDEIIAIDEDTGATIAANPNTRTVDLDRTQSAAGSSLVTGTLHKSDQVLVQGARRRNCFSLSYQDGTLESDWDTNLADEYITAASGAGDYPAENAERLRRNREARAADKFDSVYSRFKLPDDWDFEVGDGEGGAKAPAAPTDDEPNDPQSFYRPELHLLPTTPLLEGHNYHGSRIPSEAIDIFAPAIEFRELVPLAVAELPEDPGRWVQLDRWGEVADIITPDPAGGVDRSWSADVQTHPTSLRLAINVQGGPRHALAKGHFTAVDASDTAEEDAAIVDWREIIVTVAIEDDRYCEARYPADDELEAVLDAVRLWRLDVGDDFRLDYVATRTVVGVDPTDGSLLRSTGGGFIRDDRPALRRLARLAYEWYRKDRAALSFGVSSLVPRNDLWLGDYIDTLGGDELPVASTITEIRFALGSTGGGGTPPPHRQSFVTGFGELDVTRFV